MLQLIMHFLSFLSQSVAERRQPSAGQLSRKVIHKARREASQAAEAAIARPFKQGIPLITATVDGLRVFVFGQYGFIRRPDGCLFALDRDSSGYIVQQDRFPIDSHNAVLFHYCRHAMALRAMNAALEAWRRNLGAPALSEVPFEWMCNKVDCFLSDRRYMGALSAAIAPHINRLFDAEAYELARLSCLGETKGQPLTLAEYNRVVTHLPEWRSVRQQAKSLLPVIGWAYARQIITNPANLLGDTRAWLLGCGMTAAEWRLLNRLTHRKITILLDKWDPAGETLGNYLLRFTRHWVALDVTPTTSWLRRYLRSQRAGLVPPVWFDRAALAHTQALDSAARKEFLRGAYAEALDWLRAYQESGLTPDANQRHQGWTWIQHQSDRWHREAPQRLTGKKKAWHSLVPAYDEGPYRIIPLTSSDMLVAEGKRMHHCVGRKCYANECTMGQSRFFSIEKNGERVSTVQLVPRGNSWQVYQNNGIANTNPGREAHAVAARLAERYTRAAAGTGTVPPPRAGA